MRKLLMFVLLTLSIQAANIGVNEKLGAMIPLDMTFIDEKGEKVTLKQMMDGKPTMLSLNYYRCSGICNAQLSDMAKMLGELDLKENRDYKVITVSFGEGETSVLADAKRIQCSKQYHESLNVMHGTFMLVMVTLLRSWQKK